jgi:hypothetical protein
LSRRPSSGFTISEIVIILVIIAILLLIAIPQFTRPTLTTVTAPDSVVATGASGPIAIRVTARGGAPQTGVAVRFEAQGRGTVTPAEVRTDSAGIATATWQAAADTGSMVVTARAAGRAQPVVVLRTRVRTQAPTAPIAQP